MESITKSGETNQRLLCIDTLRGFDMLWIIGFRGVLIAFSKATGIGFKLYMPHELAVLKDGNIIISDRQNH